jgi:hypothetical protein
MNYLPQIISAAPAVFETINELLPSTSKSAQSDTTVLQDNQGMSSSQSAINSPVLRTSLPKQPLASNHKNSSSGLTVPFQTFLHRHTGDHKFLSMAVDTIPQIVTLVAMSQVAELIELEIVINPTLDAMTYGATIQACWTPSYLTPDQYNVCSVYGAQEVTFGGTYHVGGFTVPCDLTSVNPVIKSPLTFNNIPRFSINCWLSKEATSKKAFGLADIFLRGKVHLSVPTLVMGTGTPLPS